MASSFLMVGVKTVSEVWRKSSLLGKSNMTALAVLVGVLIQDCLASAGVSSSLSAGTKKVFLSEGIRQDNRLVHCNDTGLKMSFPSIDYAFAGYDVVEGYPLSRGRDPGFRAPIFKADYANGKANGDCRYMLPKGITAVPDVSCDVSFKSDVIKTTAEFHKSLSASANIQGGGWGFEFSASSSYQKSSSDMSSREYVYIISRAKCTAYFSRMEVSTPPPLDEGFLEKARGLAADSVSDDVVNKFIETYGTHFLDEVTFGSSYTHEHRMSTSSYKTLSKSKFGLSVQASYSGLFSVGGGFSLDTEQQQAASTFSKSVETSTVTVGSAPPSNGDALTWASVSKENPVPVSYRLRPMEELFTARYFGSDSNIAFNKIKTRLQDAPRKSCALSKSKGVAVTCTSPRNYGTTQVVTINGGYPRLPSGLTEFVNTFYLTPSQPGCQLMCSVSKQCVGYSSALRNSCFVVNNDGKEYEWRDSSSESFTLYFNKLVTDLIVKNKVPMAVDTSQSPERVLYAYYQSMYAEDTKEQNLKDCRKLCVRDPKCLAFRFGRCHSDKVWCSDNRGCYIYHSISNLKSITLTDTEFHFVSK